MAQGGLKEWVAAQDWLEDGHVCFLADVFGTGARDEPAEDVLDRQENKIGCQAGGADQTEDADRSTS